MAAEWGGAERRQESEAQPNREGVASGSATRQLAFLFKYSKMKKNMADDKQKIDAPSSFWGIGGMTCVLLSLAIALLMVFAAGAVIGGAVVGLLGVTAGLVCMGIGITKNRSGIDNIATTKNVSTANNIQMNDGHAAEKQQNTEKRKDHLQSGKINIEQAYISKKMVNDIKSQLLNK